MLSLLLLLLSLSLLLSVLSLLLLVVVVLLVLLLALWNYCYDFSSSHYYCVLLTQLAVMKTLGLRSGPWSFVSAVRTAMRLSVARGLPFV